MKNRILPLSLGIVALLVLLANPNRPDKDMKVESTNPWLVYGIDYGHPTFFDTILDTYLKENPHASITMVKYPPDQYSKALNASLLSDTPPDLYQVEASWLHPLEEKGVLADTVGLIASSYGLLTNQSLLGSADLPTDSPPKTLQDMVHYGTVISKKRKGFNIYGFALPLSQVLQTMQDCLISPYTAYGYGLDHGSIDYGQYGPWFQAIRELRGSDSLYPGHLALTKEKVLHEFASGSIGMIIGDSLDLYLIQQRDPSFSVAIYPIPPLKAGDHQEEIGYGDFYVGVRERDASIQDLFAYLQSDTATAILRDQGLQRPSSSIKPKDQLIMDPVLEDLFLPLLTYDSQATYEETLGQLNTYYLYLQQGQLNSIVPNNPFYPDPS